MRRYDLPYDSSPDDNSPFLVRSGDVAATSSLRAADTCDPFPYLREFGRCQAGQYIGPNYLLTQVLKYFAAKASGEQVLGWYFGTDHQNGPVRSHQLVATSVSGMATLRHRYPLPNKTAGERCAY